MSQGTKKRRARRRVDPYAAREAARYEHPIASREFIMERLADVGRPVTLEWLADDLKLDDEQARIALQRRANAMARDGQLIRNRRDEYCLVNKADLVTGRVVGHPDGFGFLVPDEGGGDLFLSARQMRRLLHGDRAVARVAGVDRRGRREGAVVEVLERANHQVVGRFFLEGPIGFVAPHNARIHQDIVIPVESRKDAHHGQFVVAEIVEQPNSHSGPVGRIEEVLGDHMAPGMEIDVAIRAYELPREWSPAVEEEAAQFGTEVPEQAVQDREDLRDVPLVTIDGEDARDFDDAVYCEPHGKGWRLIVAIADVSYYVKPQSALDEEALERGNSVYFPDRVLPMLPEVLSNGLCSLNPEVDRLCMACEIWFTPKGKIRRYRFFDAVMRSHARLTYTAVAEMLVERDADLLAKHRALVPHLENLYGLYQVLRSARDARGAIDFDTTETRIMFGETRKIERIVPVVRNDAHRLIEECMVAANIAAADYLLSKDIPIVYRIHEGPTAEKLAELRDFLAELGLSLGGGADPRPRDYAKLLSVVQQRPDTHLIQTVLLRSLTQAVYSPDNVGHFGLAYDAYTHFTSPIRRYPDLLVHRAIRHLNAANRPETFRYSHGDMVRFGEHCSMTDRRAEDATRDAVDWLKCEYMLDKVGMEFGGIISSVTSFGLFVELEEIYVEGLVHVTALENDYYHFDPVKHRLTGERTGITYRLADPVTVRVVRVDLDERKIDFELAVTPEPKRSRGHPTRRKKAAKSSKRSAKRR